MSNGTECAWIVSENSFNYKRKEKIHRTITYERTKSNTLDGSFMIELPESWTRSARDKYQNTAFQIDLYQSYRMSNCREKHTPNGYKFKKKKSRKPNG